MRRQLSPRALQCEGRRRDNLVGIPRQDRRQIGWQIQASPGQQAAPFAGTAARRARRRSGSDGAWRAPPLEGRPDRRTDPMSNGCSRRYSFRACCQPNASRGYVFPKVRKRTITLRVTRDALAVSAVATRGRSGQDLGFRDPGDSSALPAGRRQAAGLGATERVPQKRRLARW
jgi:hypothetical protein